MTGSGDTNATVQVFVNGVAQGMTTTDSRGNWRFACPALARGSHLLYAEATDALGNTGNLSSPLEVTV